MIEKLKGLIYQASELIGATIAAILLAIMFAVGVVFVAIFKLLAILYTNLTFRSR